MGSDILRSGWLRALAGCALAASLTACGEGQDDGANSGVTPPASAASATLTFAAKSDKSYATVKGRSGSTVEVYRSSSGAVAQSLYRNAGTGERVRVFNDADGLPERVLDEASGNALTITRTGTDRIDYRGYDAAGKFLGGYAVLVKADGLYAASVNGSPSFEGQISAQMNGASQTGSFALLPAADAGMGTPVRFSAASLAFVDALPAMATAASTRDRPLAALGIDRRAVLGGLAMGLAVGASTTVLPGLVAGAMTAYALQRIGLPIFDGVNNATTIEQMSENLNTFLDRFNQGASANTSMSDTLAGLLSSRVTGAVQRAFDATKDSVSAVVDRLSQPALASRAPATDTAVSGFGVDQSGTNYSVTGNVGAGGALTAVAAASSGGDTVRINGNVVGSGVSGTISGRLGNGTVAGAVALLGQCAALQQSGGQGTFSFAFDAGSASGTLTFYRNAYSIPDGFRVISNGQTLYDTGGLVSGADSRQLTLAGSRSLFVTVNAPNSGTAWELTVGCPS